MGLSIWPDNERDRVKIVVESVRSAFSTEYIADRAEVAEETARRELDRLSEQGFISRAGDGKWRVITDALDEDGLFPDDE